jgi:hypothetical protein
MGGLWPSAQGRGLEVESQRISPMGFLCWPSSISARLAELAPLQCPLLGAFPQSSDLSLAPSGCGGAENACNHSVENWGCLQGVQSDMCYDEVAYSHTKSEYK